MKYLILGILFLNGCTSIKFEQPKAVATKDGKPLYSVKCKKDIEGCYKRASKICNGEFDVVDGSSTTSGSMYVGNGMFAHKTSNNMIFTCKVTPAYTPAKDSPDET